MGLLFFKCIFLIKNFFDVLEKVLVVVVLLELFNLFLYFVERGFKFFILLKKIYRGKKRKGWRVNMGIFF